MASKAHKILQYQTFERALGRHLESSTMRNAGNPDCFE